MDTALVIAATSFVGRHLCNRLRAADVSVQGTSRTPSSGLLGCDLTCPEQIEQVLRSVRPRWIFQCAGATTQSTAADLFRLHQDGTRDLLEAVHRYVPNAVVVLFGSAAEYGPVPAELLPIREDTPTQPRSLYGQSKLAQFNVAEQLTQAYGLRVHVVRPFNLLGPGLGTHYFAAALCARLQQRKQAGEFGVVPISNAQATRDWVDVRDVVEAVFRLARNAEPPQGRIGLANIATGQETSVLTLAAHLCRLAGDFEAVDQDRCSSRTEIERSCGDSSRLQAWTGWQPRITWQDSLRSMWVDHQAACLR